MSVRRHGDIDRGWAWVAAMSVYLTMIINCTTLYMGGVIYIALLEKYNEGKAKTSLVGALNSGLLCVLCEYCLTCSVFDTFQKVAFCLAPYTDELNMQTFNMMKRKMFCHNYICIKRIFFYPICLGKKKKKKKKKKKRKGKRKV